MEGEHYAPHQIRRIPSRVRSDRSGDRNSVGYGGSGQRVLVGSLRREQLVGHFQGGLQAHGAQERAAGDLQRSDVRLRWCHHRCRAARQLLRWYARRQDPHGQGVHERRLQRQPGHGCRLVQRCDRLRLGLGIQPLRDLPGLLTGSRREGQAGRPAVGVQAALVI